MSVRWSSTCIFTVIAGWSVIAAGCAHGAPGPSSAAGEARHAQPQLAFAGVPVGPAADPTEEPADPTVTPAFRYAQLDRAECETELARRGIWFTRVDEARGVLAPVRLTGLVGGVAFHSVLPERERASSPNEVFDCRLVLALDDFASILRQHDVVEVVHLSAWRPPSRRWPAGKMGTRHDGALALDAGWFVRKDGTRLDVEKDFHGRIGAKTCGPGTGPWPATPAAMELRSILCEAAVARLFQVALTPDYNRPHRNHFHLEVTPHVRWFLVH